MRNSILNSKLDLINQYNHFKLHAHGFFMHGCKEDASEHYELAFDTNKIILKFCNLDISCINRSLDACLDCLDFCTSTENTNRAYFLNYTSSIFIKILEGNYTEEIRAMALISYSQIAKISQNLENSYCYEETEKLVSRFNHLCFKNNHLLTSLSLNKNQKDFHF